MPRALYCMLLLALGARTLLAADIDGEVRIAPSSAVAVNAKVQLFNARFVVDERIVGTDGRFKFRNVTAGAYVVAVQLEGYVDEEVTLTVERRSPREFVPLTLRPAKSATEPHAETISVTSYQLPKAARREFEEGLRERKRGDCARAIRHL